MRSYTNSDGTVIEVDIDHLDAAIKIKQELRKASPSGKISWAKHKKMMEIEGYEDSGKNEAYRCMIKAEEKARGVLPSAKTHAEMIAKNTLESIREEIGEISLAKRDAQNSFRELNRLKRELSDGIALYEGVANVLKEKDFTNLKKISKKKQTSQKDKEKYMIAAISDIHFGAIVDVEGRRYDTQISENLLMEYADKILRIAKENSIESVYVMNLGDTIEGLYMRTQNLYSSEKTFSEQIVDVSELLIKFLTKLSTELEVSYSGICGNHERVSTKNDNIFSDGASVMINKIIETFAKYSPVQIEYIEAEPYHHIISKNGKNFLFVHGDRTPIKKNSVLAEQSALYGISFDALIAGHVHHFNMHEVGEDKYVATFGSIKGSDEYTLKTLNTSASRSQGLILIDEDGEFEIRKVKL